MPYRLTTDDKAIFRKAATENPSYFTDYYFGGWAFHDYQTPLHIANQPEITIIGGVGSGKTAMVAFSAATWAAMTPYFKFMNVAPTFWQAKLMYQAVLERAEGNRYGRFIERAVRRPYPTIELYNNSKLEFMSAADEIEKLRGWEGDWMNGDEFGFIDSPTTVRIMRTRLRGQRPTNRPRLGRLSVITTATDMPWLWERYDKAKENPEEYLSMTITTSMNKALSERDVRLMREALPPELRAIEMEGSRPMGTCEEFSRSVIQQCEDRTLNRLCHKGVEAKRSGFAYSERSLAGCHQFMMPPERGRDYLLVGDPGQGEPPNRNAAVVIVLDITGFPQKPARLRMFDWVYGGGSYMPFLSSFKTAMNLYRPVGAAFDATGSQKAMDELAFSDVGEGILVEGMNLTGKKQAYHNALKLTMQRGLLRFPYIRGLRRQLAQYAFPDKQLTQDIVSALQIAGGWLRRRIFSGEMAEKNTEQWTIPLLSMSRDSRPSMRHSPHRRSSAHVRRR